MICPWCQGPKPPGNRWCSTRCRQTAWRFRQRQLRTGETDPVPRRLAYADPPYPGTAKRWYGDQPSYAGEVDHAELVSRLVTYDGWALSTSSKALRMVLPLCPEGVRVCSWVKAIGVSRQTMGIHSRWEAVIVSPAREMRGGVRDWLSAHPARGGGTLPGRKPIAFCAWLFDLLGAVPGDTLDDMFPGTGVVSAAWRAAMSPPGVSDASPLQLRDAASQEYSGDDATDPRSPSRVSSTGPA